MSPVRKKRIARRTKRDVSAPKPVIDPPASTAPSATPRRRTRAASGGGGPARPDPIEHVVLLMLENRSFDHMLGALGKRIPGIDGVDPIQKRHNVDYDGTIHEQEPGAGNEVEPDPPHSLEAVLHQLTDTNGNFVREYTRAHPGSTSQQRAEVMRYFDDGALPALHQLAGSFAICDHWFSSVPGPTWTNRLFAMSGTSLGRAHMPRGVLQTNLHSYDQVTLFDRLDERAMSWKVYYGDVPLSLLLKNQRKKKNRKRHQRFSHFAADASGPADEFPTFAFIEPDYLWPGANDDHPPHDVDGGQRLIAAVYNALRGNAELWRSTLLVITYDEHGGFYDHVPPPAAVAPDDLRHEYDFTRLGVRVPTVLVSPWIDHGVVKTTFDHTSLLRYLVDRFGLGELGARTAAANSIGQIIRATGSPRTDTPTALELPKKKAAVRRRAGRPAAPRPELTDNEEAARLLAESLAPSPKPTVRRRGYRGRPKTAEDPRESARTSIESFLDG